MARYLAVGAGLTLWEKSFSFSEPAVEVTQTSITLESGEGFIVMRGIELVFDEVTGLKSGTVTSIYSYAPHETDFTLRGALVDSVTNLSIPFEQAYSLSGIWELFLGDDFILSVTPEDGYQRNETIYAMNGNDTVSTGGGDDWVYGGEGNDTIRVGTGDDWVEGGTGDDFIKGGDGYDVIYGEGENHDHGVPGNDRLYGQGGNDLIDGGTNGLGLSFMGHDFLSGGAGDDILIGRGGDDTLCGGQGDDWVFGGWGNNVMYGGDGNDIFWSGLGNDRIAGGTGEDIVFFGEDFGLLDIAKSGRGFEVSSSSTGTDFMIGVETIYALDGVFTWNGSTWMQTGDATAVQTVLSEVVSYYY